MEKNIKVFILILIGVFVVLGKVSGQNDTARYSYILSFKLILKDIHHGDTIFRIDEMEHEHIEILFDFSNALNYQHYTDTLVDPLQFLVSTIGNPLVLYKNNVGLCTCCEYKRLLYTVPNINDSKMIVYDQMANNLPSSLKIKDSLTVLSIGKYNLIVYGEKAKIKYCTCTPSINLVPGVDNSKINLITVLTNVKKLNKKERKQITKRVKKIFGKW